MNKSEFEMKLQQGFSGRPVGVIESVASSGLKVAAKTPIKIKDKWVGVVIDANWKCHFGRFTTTDEIGNAFTFELDEQSSISEFRAGDRVFYFDSYWGERIEIILDRDAEWKEMKFHSGIGIKFGNMLRKQNEDESAIPKGAQRIDGGWDHEHCEICMETISESTENGYQNKRNQWICKRCFNGYYDGISLGFIQA